MRSIVAGVGDLVGLPLAALGAGSPTAFVAGLGTGSVSLLRNLSGVYLTRQHPFTSLLATWSGNKLC